jgi:hypothetical protein
VDSRKKHPVVERLRIGASLLPPCALLWWCCRRGWVPFDPHLAVWTLPAALATGFLWPAPFLPWHRRVESVRSWLGGLLLRLLLLLVWIAAILPVGLALRLAGKRFLDPGKREGYWQPARPFGSLRDGF